MKGRKPSWEASDRESEGWRWRDGAFGSAASMNLNAGDGIETRCNSGFNVQFFLSVLFKAEFIMSLSPKFESFHSELTGLGAK